MRRLCRLRSPHSLPHHSEGLPSLGEATLVQRHLSGKQTHRILRPPRTPAAFSRHSATTSTALTAAQNRRDILPAVFPSCQSVIPSTVENESSSTPHRIGREPERDDRAFSKTDFRQASVWRRSTRLEDQAPYLRQACAGPAQVGRGSPQPAAEAQDNQATTASLAGNQCHASL